MAKEKKSRSLIYEILIVILIGGLLGSLLIPKRIWDIESKNEEECQSRLLNLWTLETFFKQKTDSYAASVDTLIEVLKSDSAIMTLLDTFYTRSIFPNEDTLETIYKMPIDSVRTCPLTGMEYYIALSDSIPFIRINCPNVESTVPVYFVFKKKIINHGSIIDGKVSW